MIERFETFTVLIASINHSIRKLKSEAMAEFDLKSPHLYCIYYLHKSKALTAKELCELCSADKAAISRSIKYLEKEDYIVCKHNAPKRYRTQLELTDKGRAVGEKIATRAEEVLNLVGDKFDDSDREVLYRSLHTINGKLTELCDQYDKK